MKQKEKLNVLLTVPIPKEFIERRIYIIRGIKVMLDSDLAELYQVATFNLNKAVKRNFERFPQDFMFQLNQKEHQNLIFQFGISSYNYGGRRYFPYAFTEQGVAMLSSVLRSPRAIAVNIAIMRAFVKLREIMATHKDLARKIEDLEAKQQSQQLDISVIFKVIKKMVQQPEPPKNKIGFA